MSPADPALVLVLALAGGLGAVARLVLDGETSAHVPNPWEELPLGTLAINATGSLALGLLGGLLAAQVLDPALQLVAGTGFLGGYTTFSTASVETVRLLQRRRWGAALAAGPGSLLICTVCALLGVLLGSAL